jgi:CPA2 family monovalent cation:H+ antiporter-2
MRGWPGGRLGQAARVQGFGQIPAANIGLTILGRGEFSIILAALAASAGLDPRIGPFVALYVLILAVLGPLLAARSRSFARLLPASLFPATAGPGPPRIPE